MLRYSVIMRKLHFYIRGYDISFNFDEVEMEKEKSVVLEEIATVEDTPDDDVHEQLMEYDVSHTSNRKTDTWK